MTYGYLRVSTVEQDNNKFQGEILLYSNKNHLGHVSFVEEKVTGVKDWKLRELGRNPSSSKAFMSEPIIT